MKESNNIIVLSEYKNAIDAHIVKTKLDAHGIPCFLSDENLANTYPGTSFSAFYIRLHIFENDHESALQIIEANKLMVMDDSMLCPACHSEQVERTFPKKLNETLGGVFILLFGVLFPQQKVRHCMDCEHEF